MDQSQNFVTQTEAPKRSKKKVVLLTLLTVLVAVGLVGATYAYQQSKLNKLEEESASVSSRLKTAETKLEETSAVDTKTLTEPSQSTSSSANTKGEELVKTVRAYSIGRKMGFGNSTAYTISSKKTVGDFTRVNLSYKDDQGSECCSMLFKNVENRWVLATDISFVNPEGDNERVLQVEELNRLGVPKGQGLVNGSW